MFLSSKHDNSRYSNFNTHIYINAIDYHYYKGMHYMKPTQRVSIYLNTNSHLLNFRKYKKTNSSKLFKMYNFRFYILVPCLVIII